MVYSYFADRAKRFAHLGIEYTFPRTGTIALVSAGAGWYAHRYILTHAPGRVSQATESVFGNTVGDFMNTYLPSLGEYGKSIGYLLGHLIAPLYAPDVSKYAAEEFSIGVSVVTSFVLNMLAQAIFGIKSVKDDKHLLQKALKEAGLEPIPEKMKVQRFQKDQRVQRVQKTQEVSKGSSDKKIASSLGVEKLLPPRVSKQTDIRNDLKGIFGEDFNNNQSMFCVCW